MPPVKKPEAPKYVHQEFPKHLYTRDVYGAVQTLVVKGDAAFAAATAKGAVESPADLPPGQDLDPDDVGAVLTAKDAEIAQLKAALLANAGGDKGEKADKGDKGKK